MRVTLGGISRFCWLTPLLAIGLFLQLDAPSAYANEAICVPSLDQTTVWNCTSKNLVDAKCATPIANKLAADWHGIETEEAAYVLLKKKYAEFADAEEFVRWMHCQGFKIYAQPSQRSSKGILLLTRFDRTEIVPFALSYFDFWGLLGLKRSQAFNFTLDDFGAILILSTFEHY